MGLQTDAMSSLFDWLKSSRRELNWLRVQSSKQVEFSGRVVLILLQLQVVIYNCNMLAIESYLRQPYVA